MLGGGKEGLRRGAFEDFALGDEGDAVGCGSGESHLVRAEDDFPSGADEGDPLLLPATELDVETRSGEKNEMNRQQ